MSEYTKDHPFTGSLIDRFSLCHNSSQKSTYHLAIDIKGSDIRYEVGDSIGVLPINNPVEVDKILKSITCNADERIIDPRDQSTSSIKEFLLHKANISRVSSKFADQMIELGANPSLADRKESMDRKEFRSYLEEFHIWDFLIEFGPVQWPAQDFVSSLSRLIPRLYSIASSPLVYPQEVHFTIAVLHYETRGHTRKGVCSHYLCEQLSLHSNELGVYLQKSKDFRLPEDDNTPIIMIGPGTGIAPFRAFIQERIAKNAKGKNWLFFGEWTREGEFFYQDYWMKLQAEGRLRLDTAFSRDQETKVYVQHRMQEQAADLWQWIEKEGAVLYICGDAKNMAKDVEQTLLSIIQEEGERSEEEAKAYIKQLKQEKRYLKDVY
ncbi:MAG: sulfite reductase [Waddliaceae bacterium]|nr:sulfite reductase [Waddliaceae bacterium]